jgi:lipoprotein-releasing system ATP-binding protein
MADIIELKRVEKVYVNGAVETRALDGIDLSFEEGSFNSIISESGSGKSTLLNVMGTLDRPTDGEVYIDGQRTDQMKKNELASLRNEKIGFVFQFHYLLPEFSALENVMMPHWIAGTRKDDDLIQRAEELLELVDISKVRDKLATQMSGGQQQRTAIARALINQPSIILADEPSGNLDSENTRRLYGLFRNINEETGTTFVIVTHDRRIAEQTDRIVEIRDGRIEMDVRK